MTTKTIEITDAVLKDMEHFALSEPVIVTRASVPLYAIVPLDEDDYAAWRLSETPEFMEAIERSREQLRRDGGGPLDEVRHQLGLSG